MICFSKYNNTAKKYRKIHLNKINCRSFIYKDTIYSLAFVLLKLIYNTISYKSKTKNNETNFIN